MSADSTPAKSKNLHSAFVQTSFVCRHGYTVGRIIPKNPQPILARPGMCVVLTDATADAGVIIACTEEACVVRDSLGGLLALPWAEVELAYVIPDPAYLVPEAPKANGSKR